MLSLTFGKPVIAPRIGALLDLPESVGYFYDPKLSNGLEESISRAINDKEQLRVKGRNAVTFTRTLNWNDIAQRTIDVYKNALNVSTKI
jgi:glycosyltransferase involved in cell wall biosynthesis